MTCFTPIQAYKSKSPNSEGNYYPVFSIQSAMLDINGMPVFWPVACRKCEGCRFAKSTDWMVRLELHHREFLNLSTGEYNSSFLTLTYAPQHIPTKDGWDTLYYKHMKTFFNSLRKRLDRAGIKHQLSYFGIGEYGDESGRPHYHVLLFGYNFPDKYYHRTTDTGEIVYRSPMLESLWQKGHSEIGTVTAASCGYVSRYTMKKVIGQDVDGKYRKFNPATGVITHIAPERHFISNGGGKSKRGGIGKQWFQKYAKSDMYKRIDTDVYKDGTHLTNGMSARPPAYFDKLLKVDDPDLASAISHSRLLFVESKPIDIDELELQAKRDLLLHRVSKLKRRMSSKNFTIHGVYNATTDTSC